MQLTQEHNRDCKRRAAKEFVVAVPTSESHDIPTQQKEKLMIKVADVNMEDATDPDLRTLGKEITKAGKLAITVQQRTNTDQTLSSFLEKELGLKSITKKEFRLTKRHYTQAALYSEDPSQSQYPNDKFVLGLDLQESQLSTDLCTLSLLFNSAISEELLLLVRAIVAFTHKKGCKISQRRPLQESRAVKVALELYRQILAELKEAAKEESKETHVPPKKTNQARLPQYLKAKDVYPSINEESYYQPGISCITCQSTQGELMQTQCKCKIVICRQCWSKVDSVADGFPKLKKQNNYGANRN